MIQDRQTYHWSKALEINVRLLTCDENLAPEAKEYLKQSRDNHLAEIARMCNDDVCGLTLELDL